MKHYLVSYYLAPLEFDEARLPNFLGDFGVGLVDFLGCIEWCLGLRMKGRGKEEEEGGKYSDEVPRVLFLSY